MENKKPKAKVEKSVQLNYKRVSLNVPMNVHEKVVKFAEQNGFNYSQAIISRIQKSLQQDLLIDALPKILEAMEEKKSKDKNNTTNFE